MLTDYVSVKAKMYTNFPAFYSDRFPATLFENVCFIYECPITDQNYKKTIITQFFQFSNARLKAYDEMVSLRAGSSVKNGARSTYKGLVTSQEKKSLQRSHSFFSILRSESERKMLIGQFV